MKRRLPISNALLAARVLDGLRECSALIAEAAAPQPARPALVRAPAARPGRTPPR